MMEKVEVTRCFVGLCHMQVCCDPEATDDEILDVCNKQNPSGTSHGWSTVCKNDDEFWGKITPIPCKDFKDRIHYMVSC